MKKSCKRLREKPSGSDEERDEREGAVDVKPSKIRDLTPIQEFEAVLSRRDESDWVNKAIREIRNKIHDLLEDSCQGDKYNKTLECLLALRKGCVVEQEPKQFYEFLRYISNFCREHSLGDFCELLLSKEVTPIAKEEAEDSDMTGDEAGTFMLTMDPKHEPKAEP